MFSKKRERVEIVKIFNYISNNEVKDTMVSLKAVRSSKWFIQIADYRFIIEELFEKQNLMTWSTIVSLTFRDHQSK